MQKMFFLSKQNQILQPFHLFWSGFDFPFTPYSYDLFEQLKSQPPIVYFERHAAANFHMFTPRGNSADSKW